MDRRQVLPTFSNPPSEYEQRYLQDLVRSLNDLVTQLRTPGLGRQTTSTFTNVPTDPDGLEPGTIWNDLGIARFAGFGPLQLAHPAVYGQISHTSDVTVPIGTAGTFVSTGVVGTLDTAVAEGIALGTSDTFAIKNVTGRTIRTPVYGSIDAQTSGTNKVLAIRLAVNGTSVPETECRANQATAGVEAKLVTRWIFELEPDDEVSLQITNITDTTNITFRRGRIVAA